MSRLTRVFLTSRQLTDGSIRFGDTAVQKMKEWTVKNLPASREPAPRIMECGCGTRECNWTWP